MQGRLRDDGDDADCASASRSRRRSGMRPSATASGAACGPAFRHAGVEPRRPECRCGGDRAAASSCRPPIRVLVDDLQRALGIVTRPRPRRGRDGAGRHPLPTASVASPPCVKTTRTFSWPSSCRCVVLIGWNYFFGVPQMQQQTQAQQTQPTAPTQPGQAGPSPVAEPGRRPVGAGLRAPCPPLRALRSSRPARRRSRAARASRSTRPAFARLDQPARRAHRRRRR